MIQFSRRLTDFNVQSRETRDETGSKFKVQSSQNRDETIDEAGSKLKAQSLKFKKQSAVV